MDRHLGYDKIVKIFDEDETAGSFLREDGEGGFASGVYRMAREIERLRGMILWIGEYEPYWLEQAEKKFGPVALKE